ncbi:MAG: hypothetical protein AB1733_07965 [Thermodesulfobacteriota bacterium]
MKTRILVAILVASLAVPSVSHAFGLLRYAFDAVSNQLGLDRGPVPKIPARPVPAPLGPGGVPLGKHADTPRLYIQADGF